MATRNRRDSDVSSGLELKREDYPSFSDDDVARNFELFRAYDLDSSGFITAENMLAVLQALDMDVSMESVHGMIDEVATLTGHANDGKLSFRDFMAMAFHDAQATAKSSPAVDAAAETTPAATTPDLDDPETPDVDEPESPVGAPASEPKVAEPSQAPPPPLVAKRRSSMSALNALASGRIKAFQQVAIEAAEREKELSKFKRQPTQVAGPMVNSDEMHLETLQSKLKAFEVAAHYKGKTELRKTWKQAGGAGNYQSSRKVLVGGMPAGVAPKKKLSDLP